MADRMFFSPVGNNSTNFTQNSEGLTLQDTIQGNAQRNARMWQIIALVSLSSFFISLIFLIIAINLPETVPVIVTVNPDGETNYVGKVTKSMYGNNSIPEIAKEYLIKKLIENMHTWVIDQNAQKKYISETQAIVQSGAIRQLDTFYRNDNPYNHLGLETRTVKLQPILKQADKTYICYFNVITRNIDGYERSNERWSALLNIDSYESTPENPLGIYITNFDLKLIAEENK